MFKTQKRLIQRLKRIHIENKGLKLLAFLLAIILFVVSKQPISDVRLTGIPIEFRGPGNTMDVSVESQQLISVRLRGPRDIVRSLTPNQLAVVANLNSRDPGERTIQFRPDDVLRPDNIQVLQIEPASIRIRIDQLVGRIVPIKPGFVDKPPEGYEVYSWSISPSEIEIEGPQQQIREILNLTTEAIRLRDRTTEFISQVDVQPLQQTIRVKTPGPITVKVEVGETRISRTLHGVKVKWEDIPQGYRLLTKTVSIVIKGPASIVRQIEADQITARIKTARPPGVAGSIVPDIDLPEFLDNRIKVVSVTPSEVRYKNR